MRNRRYRNLLILSITTILILLLIQTALAAQIKLAWNANTESELVGYKIYYGTITKAYTISIDVGNITTFTVTGLTQGQTYYIAVTAYDTYYNESGFSNEVYGIAIELEPPPPAPAPTITPTPTPTETKGKKLGWSKKGSGIESQMVLAASAITSDGSAIGNIKSYEISALESSSNSSNSTNSNNPSNSSNLVVVDATNTSALDSGGLIRDTSRSLWSSQTDGNQVNQGGVGEALLSRSGSRNIFTNLGDPNLMADSNTFETSNENITPELLGFAPGDTVNRDKLIQYIQGYDVYSNVKGASALVKRAWILGAIVNSRPLVIPYGNSRSVIFVGASDGMLHAFDNATGEELWGFIPYELLTRLKELPQSKGLNYYVDGAPKAYITSSQKIVVFGLRRGGDHYYALDVTNPNSPRFLWSIGPETTGYSEMGQTWSTPQIGMIKYGTGGKVVFFIGGGYDESQDKGKQNVGDKKGRAVYVVDLFTGTQIWRWDYARDPKMIYCIPSDVSCVDTNGDGYIDRLYVGDMGGRLWRFDLVESDPTAWSGSLLFNSSAGLLGGMRKIFSRPDVTLENGYEMVFFGTGDREHPDETKVINQIYAIKDRGLNSILSQKDLENVTDGINSESIEGKAGWFISLENKGEKALAPPVVMFGVAYFTTFTPLESPAIYGGDLERKRSFLIESGAKATSFLTGFTPPSGSSTEGVARLYALNYKTGGPIIDLNPENNTDGVRIDLSDRSKVIGRGIPSMPVISAMNGKLFAYTRFQGGVYNTPLKKNSTIIPIWWREVRK